MCDRVKDMILTGGENVYSLEVERVLSGHAWVLHSCVYGVPNEFLGEAVKAVVVLTNEAAELALVSSAVTVELSKHCSSSLADFKIPRTFEYMQLSNLPMTGSGKIAKAELRRADASRRRDNIAASEQADVGLSTPASAVPLAAPAVSTTTFLRIAWRRSSLHPAMREPGCRILLLAEDAVAQEVATVSDAVRLQHRDIICSPLVTAPQPQSDEELVLQSAFGDADHAFFLWPADDLTTSVPARPLCSLAETELQLSRLLATGKASLAAPNATLWIVTRGAGVQPTGESMYLPNAASMQSLWGFARVLRAEALPLTSNPRRVCGQVVDLCPCEVNTTSDAGVLLCEVSASMSSDGSQEGSTEAVYRRRARFVPRLAPVFLPSVRTGGCVRTDASYVITGGLGDLGLLLGHRLASGNWQGQTAAGVYLGKRCKTDCASRLRGGGLLRAEWLARHGKDVVVRFATPMDAAAILRLEFGSSWPEDVLIDLLTALPCVGLVALQDHDRTGVHIVAAAIARRLPPGDIVSGRMAPVELVGLCWQRGFTSVTSALRQAAVLLVPDGARPSDLPLNGCRPTAPIASPGGERSLQASATALANLNSCQQLIMDVAARLHSSFTGWSSGQLDTGFMDLGLDSADTTELVALLNSAGNFGLDQNAPFLHPTIRLCRSQLVAMHAASAGMVLGDHVGSLSASMSFILSPVASVYHAQAMMLSADGRCKTLDTRANGYSRAEGMCAVFLTLGNEESRVAAMKLGGSVVRQGGKTDCASRLRGGGDSVAMPSDLQTTFDRWPLDEQPTVLAADCTDRAQLLSCAYKHVRDHTMRGQWLGEYPLLLVYQSDSEAAREDAATMPREAHIPCQTTAQTRVEAYQSGWLTSVPVSNCYFFLGGNEEAPGMTWTAPPHRSADFSGRAGERQHVVGV